MDKTYRIRQRITIEEVPEKRTSSGGGDDLGGLLAFVFGFWLIGSFVIGIGMQVVMVTGIAWEVLQMGFTWL